MSFKKSIAQTPVLRSIVLAILKRFNFSLRIRNHYTGDKLTLKAYTHKGYWFYGRTREKESMDFFKDLIQDGDCVLEVGAHIGFITQYFSTLAGNSGSVHTFEPGSNNLPFLTKNIAKKTNVTLVKKGLSNTTGSADFYEDNITGQNNSILPDYTLADEVAATHGQKICRTVNSIELTTLDLYCKEQAIAPTFIKIDTEGFEKFILQGATETLQTLPTLMVEVTENHKEVADILENAGFKLYYQDRASIDTADIKSGNVFALKPDIAQRLNLA